MSTVTKPIILDETGQAIVEQLSLIGGSSSVHYTPDINKTSAEKLQARTNIGAGTSNFSGDYNDLSNQPAIPSKTSDITNDSGFIDNTVNNLTNYRSSSDQDAIDNTLQPKTDNLLSTVSKNVVGAINENKDSIDNLKAIGRFLAVWNCTTGLPTTNPSTSPYTYKTGDYFLVGTVGTTNYKPNGSTYTIGVASTTVETNEVTVSDYYVYDGTDWILLKNTQKALTFANITGQPSDNSALNTALAGKVGFTNYPTSGTGGVIKANPTAYGFGVDSSGGLFAPNYSYNDYTSKVGTFNVGKGTLENVLDNESLRIDKTQSLSSAQKSQAYTNLGAVASQGIPIATSISSASTNAEVPSSLAVKNALAGTDISSRLTFSSKVTASHISAYRIGNMVKFVCEIAPVSGATIDNWENLVLGLPTMATDYGYFNCFYLNDTTCTIQYLWANGKISATSVSKPIASYAINILYITNEA